jgi:hypothetical protein
MMDIADMRFEGAAEDDLIQRIIDLFDHKRLAIGGPNSAAAAAQIAAQQQQLHKHAIGAIFSGAVRGNGPLPRDTQTYLTNLIDRAVVPGVAVTAADETIEGGGTVVMSLSIPILDDKIGERIAAIFANVKDTSHPDIGELLVASYLRGMRLIIDRSSNFEILGYRYFPAAARLEAFDVNSLLVENGASTLQSRIQENVETAFTDFASASAAIQEKVSVLDATVRLAVEQAGKMSESIKELHQKTDKASAAVDAALADFEDRYAQADAKAKAFMEAVRAEANFEDLKIHWTNRAGSAWWAFWISVAALLVLLVFLPLVAIFEHAAIIRFMKQLADAASTELGTNPDGIAITVATVSRLLVVTIPVALYFWLIRLVVRFSMRSLLLMDDANARATMLETYFRMIAQQAATVEDRALVLQALMRPTPGHGPDTVEPPNFTEVIDRAMGRGAH